MSLVPGTAFGAYEIVAPLGRGGMGEVYRVRDTRLGRDVALKVLPFARLDDPDSRARFEREARTLAALNDPHIATIHDIIDIGDHRAIVMELVEGPTLDQVMASGPVPLRTALTYAIHMSEALAVAHAAGIVHRDLKPANVVIAASGSAKVLDFGIAKLRGDDAAAAMEESTMGALTQDHAIVGTPGYLSPEQAHGRPADARSDIFSLGVVLHEMIAGTRAFQGDSAAGILSAVIRDDPPRLRTLVPATPRSVERCVARCLEKDPRLRYQSALDLRAVLEDIREDLSVQPVAAADALAVAAPPPLARALRAAKYMAAGVVIAAAGFLTARAVLPPATLMPNYRPFITEAAAVVLPVWSPDGRTLAYLAESGGHRRLFLRALESTQSTQVTAQDADGISLMWSPDGVRLYFTRASDGNLVAVNAGGGEPQLVATAFAGKNTGAATRLPGGLKACITPDGRTLVFTRGEDTGVRLWAIDLATNAAHALELAGLPRPLANVQAMAFSPDGARLAMIASTTALNDAKGAWLISWPGGSVRRVFDDAPYLASNPSIGWLPDSRRFVTNGHPSQGGTNRLLIADVDSDTLTPLTGGKDDEASPSVTADGQRIAFVSRRSGLDLIQFPVDGGPPEPLEATSRNESRPDMSRSGVLAYVTDAAGSPEVRVRSAIDGWARVIGGADAPERDRLTQPFAVRLSPDDQRIAVEAYGAEHLIWIYPVAGGTPVRLDSETTDQHGPSWSPDGNWIAYRRLRDGRWELVKQPLGGGTVQRLDDAEPGGGPTDWSPDGQWIAQSRPDGMHLVSPAAGTTRLLAGLRSGAFRFSRDGSQLFAVRRGENRRWELAVWDIAGARQTRVVPLPLASAAEVQGMTLSPDDSRVVVAAGRRRTSGCSSSSTPVRRRGRRGCVVDGVHGRIRPASVIDLARVQASTSKCG